MSDSVHVRHILVEHRYQADDVLKKLDEGADFAALAKSFSTCPSAAAGGDLGVFGRGRMVAAFEEAAFGLDVGATSEPVQTRFGYHLIQRLR